MGDIDPRCLNAVGGCHPSAGDVDALIRRAADHPLGREFLLSGSLDAVAATFQVHAFVVDAARDRLGAGRPAPQVTCTVTSPGSALSGAPSRGSG